MLLEKWELYLEMRQDIILLQELEKVFTLDFMCQTQIQVLVETVMGFILMMTMQTIQIGDLN